MSYSLGNIQTLLVVSDDESDVSHNSDVKEGNSKPVHEDEGNNYCYIVGLGLDCKFIDPLIKRSINIFIKISLYLNFIVLEIISKQTDTLI